ncbi:putative zinc carboxypeptidase [Toxoplasma gondii GAB2-2007-GAL-DOM2]|uniref:Putative zinc carboxypeptidase n=3 Tax=Toxoplasma gondii TaxID=5811 RepID=V4Z8D8_TOXGV|nr:putative zinc carboxypeptidase [Toxoplasma gondii VEG]KFG35642.1 putative zinc carboxypeptidase [Toxoplasma gondii GAB2-2007-GAL-DOM2]CEL72190.1 TPA: zinc carboxypeptidase, putative [Toxoplasma gondii VEG]
MEANHRSSATGGRLAGPCMHHRATEKTDRKKAEVSQLFSERPLARKLSFSPSVDVETERTTAARDSTSPPYLGTACDCRSLGRGRLLLFMSSSVSSSSSHLSSSDSLISPSSTATSHSLVKSARNLSVDAAADDCFVSPVSSLGLSFVEASRSGDPSSSLCTHTSVSSNARISPRSAADSLSASPSESPSVSFLASSAPPAFSLARLCRELDASVDSETLSSLPTPSCSSLRAQSPAELLFGLTRRRWRDARTRPGSFCPESLLSSRGGTTRPRQARARELVASKYRAEQGGLESFCSVSSISVATAPRLRLNSRGDRPCRGVSSSQEKHLGQTEVLPRTMRDASASLRRRNEDASFRRTVLTSVLQANKNVTSCLPPCYRLSRVLLFSVVAVLLIYVASLFRAAPTAPGVRTLGEAPQLRALHPPFAFVPTPSLLFASAARDPVPSSSSSVSSVAFKARPVAPYTYEEILKELGEIQETCRSLVRVSDWGRESGLSVFMSRFSCGTSDACQLPLVEVGDIDFLSPATPTVFFSGAVHGDERAGPTAAVELVRYLCARYRRDGEVTFLVRNRRVLVMPFPNVLGFAWNFREEAGVDVNRDFPYQRQSSQCFQSVAARAINEVFRSHLILGGITWHGGMRAVAYPWGSYDHSQQLGRDRWQSRASPDDAAFKSLARVLQRAGGLDKENGDFYYPTGSMTNLVYPVSGGMEDWAYGASFEPSPDPISVCEPAPYELPSASLSSASTSASSPSSSSPSSPSSPPSSPSSPSSPPSSPSLRSFRHLFRESTKARAQGSRAAREEKNQEVEHAQEETEEQTKDEGEEASRESRRVSGAGSRRGGHKLLLRGGGDEEDAWLPRGDVRERDSEEEVGENGTASGAEEKQREGEVERRAKSGTDSLHSSEERWKIDYKQGAKRYGYPASRSVYSTPDVSSALFLVEMHDNKAPSRVSMGPRPVDRPSLLLPEEEEVETDEDGGAGEKNDFLTIRNVRLALKFIEKAKPDLLFTSTPPLYQPPGAVSIFAFYPIGCNVLNDVELQIRRGRCEDLLTVSPSFPSSAASSFVPMVPELLPAWREAEMLVREKAKTLPVRCREAGVWERRGSVSEDADLPPAEFEWWGGGGNKDITLNQGTAEQRRNRVEIQYKVPPEALDGDYCSVIFASFDQDWKYQQNPEPKMPPQSHIARLRLEDYQARSSEGNAVIVGRKTWMYPASVPALFPVVGPAGYPLIVRGDNVEGFARLDFPLAAFLPSSGLKPRQDRLPREASASVQLFLNLGGNFNEERFRYDPFTGAFRHPRDKNHALSIRRVDVSVGLSLPLSSLPPGRFLFAVFADGDLLHHAVDQFLFPASSLASSSPFPLSSVTSVGALSGRGSTAEHSLASALLLGEVPTGPLGRSELERLQQTRLANFVKRKEQQKMNSRRSSRLSSAWSLRLATQLRQQQLPAVVAFSLIDRRTVRGQADVPLTALLGRVVVAQWIPDTRSERENQGGAELETPDKNTGKEAQNEGSQGTHQKATEQAEKKGERHEDGGNEGARRDARSSDSLLSGASSRHRPSQSALAVVGSSLHTPPILHAIHEKLAPLPADPAERPASSSPPFGVTLVCFFRQETETEGRTRARGRDAERENSEDRTKGDAGERGEATGSSTSPRVEGGGGTGEEGRSFTGEGESWKGRAERGPAKETGTIEESEKGKETGKERQREERLLEHSERNAARTLLGNLVGYLRLIYRVNPIGAPSRKQEKEEAPESETPPSVRLEAELCETSMGVPPNAPLYLRFHEDCCPPLTLYPSSRPIFNLAGAASVPPQAQGFLGRLLGVSGGEETTKTRSQGETQAAGSWILPSEAQSLLSLSNCRCGPGTIVTLTTEPSASYSLHEASSFSPFSSNRFFLPPADTVDSQQRRTLACSLGLIPPVPGEFDAKEKINTPRFPFPLASAAPSISASPFLSRFICGNSGRASWRQWSARRSASGVRTQEGRWPRQREGWEAGSGHGGFVSSVEESEGDRVSSDEEFADFVTFVNTPGETREGRDGLPYHLIVASIIGLIGLVCIVSPCLISVYNCFTSRRASSVAPLPAHPRAGSTPFDEFPEFHSGEETEEGRGASGVSFPAGEPDRLRNVVDAFAKARGEGRGDRALRREGGKGIVANSNLFSSRLTGEADTLHSHEAGDAVSPPSRGLSAGSGKGASYEPFFSTAGDDSDEDVGGFS